jgi:hypothetical protein
MRQWPGSVGFPVWWRSRVLWSLAYLVVRRLFELMRLCCRSSGSKELEIPEAPILRADVAFLAEIPGVRSTDAIASADSYTKTPLRGRPFFIGFACRRPRVSESGDEIRRRQDGSRTAQTRLPPTNRYA